jgi:hypothetical protein
VSSRNPRSRNRRNLPNFRLIPTDLKRRRVARKQYARFYGNITTKTGKRKRFSFKVKVDPYKKRSAQYTLMKMTCRRILKNQIPPVPNGFVFDDFGDLLVVQDWIKVRRVHAYEAGMVYER